jgi:hypothetical protein
VSDGSHLDSVRDAFLLDLKEAKLRTKTREEASEAFNPGNGPFVGGRGSLLAGAVENELPDSLGEIPDIWGIPIEEIEDNRVPTCSNDNVISYTVPSIGSIQRPDRPVQARQVVRTKGLLVDVLDRARGFKNSLFKKSAEFERIFVLGRRDALPNRTKSGEKARVFNNPARDSGEVAFAFEGPREANRYRDVISDSKNGIVVMCWWEEVDDL